MIKINVPVKKVFPDPRSEKSLKLHLKEFIIYFKELEKFKKKFKKFEKAINNSNNNSNNNNNNNNNCDKNDSNNLIVIVIIIIITIGFINNNKILHSQILRTLIINPRTLSHV